MEMCYCVILLIYSVTIKMMIEDPAFNRVRADHRDDPSCSPDASQGLASSSRIHEHADWSRGSPVWPFTS